MNPFLLIAAAIGAWWLWNNHYLDNLPGLPPALGLLPPAQSGVVSSTLRYMGYTTFELTLRPGTTEEQADRIILERGSNSPIRSMDFSSQSGIFTVTVITDNNTQISTYDTYFHTRPEVVSVNVHPTRQIAYRLKNNHWIGDEDPGAV